MARETFVVNGDRYSRLWSVAENRVKRSVKETFGLTAVETTNQ